MPDYTYIVRDASSKISYGTLIAVNHDEVIKALEGTGLSILHISELPAPDNNEAGHSWAAFLVGFLATLCFCSKALAAAPAAVQLARIVPPLAFAACAGVLAFRMIQKSLFDRGSRQPLTGPDRRLASLDRSPLHS